MGINSGQGSRGTGGSKGKDGNREKGSKGKDMERLNKGMEKGKDGFSNSKGKDMERISKGTVREEEKDLKVDVSCVEVHTSPVHVH